MQGRPPLFLELVTELARRPEWPNRASLAQALDVGQGSVTPWLNWLLFHRAVTEERTLRVDRGRLLVAASQVRAASIRPEIPFATNLGEDEIHARLDEARIDHLLGFFTAANRWSFYEPRFDHHVYLARGNMRRVRELLATDVARARGSVQIYSEDPNSLLRQTRQGVPVTTPLQTVLDLRAHPEGGAHANFLEENLLPRLWREQG